MTSSDLVPLFTLTLRNEQHSGGCRCAERSRRCTRCESAQRDVIAEAGPLASVCLKTKEAEQVAAVCSTFLFIVPEFIPDLTQLLAEK